MAFPRKALILFVKYPEAGRVKTRLAKALGPERAADLYQKLLRRTLGIAADFKLSPDNQDDPDLFLFFSPPERKEMLKKTCPGPWKFVSQTDGHLGQRMDAAFRDVFGRRYEQIVLVGSDICDLRVSDITDAFRFLTKGAAVLGPAKDGGFYLIGLTSSFGEVFGFDSWSTPSVFERTVRCLGEAGLTVKMLSERRDIDKAEDLIHVRNQPFLCDQVSIIVPFVGKAVQLACLIDSIEAQLWPGDEIIMVRGDVFPEMGIGDITPNTRLLSAPRGRGVQLSHGAKSGKGNLYWFLHADTVPPPNFGYHVRKLSLATDAALGCFELSYGTSRFSLQLLARWANFRTRYLGLPYGDQGFFCSREVFERVGGFKKRYLFEDVDFVRACSKLGNIMVIPQPLHASPKKYLMRGIFRTSCKNHFLMFLYLLGMNDRRLYSLYYGGRSGRGLGRLEQGGLYEN